jgi:DNA-binding NarL/FixJ family response regulator
MPSNKIHLAIVDDHILFRKTLKDYISSNSDFNVVIQSSDISDLLTRLKDLDVQVILLGIFITQLYGSQVVRMIKDVYPNIKVLVLSMGTDLDVLSDLLDAGVNGILSKTEEPEELLYAIRLLSEQRIYRSKLFTEVMYWNRIQESRARTGAQAVVLNEREKEILQLLWEEKSNKEIAEHLFLSVRSVEKIRQDMKEKVSARSTVGLLKYAIHSNIIRVETKGRGWFYNLPATSIVGH